MKIILVVGVCCFSRTEVISQTLDPVSLILSKAIKAIDLKVQRLQNETLVLQQVQQAAEQKLSRTKLEEIRSWHQQLSALYASYFAELKQVKPIISDGVTVSQILALHEKTVVQYGKSQKDASTRPRFDAMLNHSRELVQTMQLILSGQIVIKDAERMAMIATLKDAMQQYYDSMQSLGRQQIEIITNRKRRQSDIQIIKRLYAIQ